MISRAMLLTITLLLAGSLLTNGQHSKYPTPVSSPATEVSTVDYCDLIGNPALYDKKIVRTTSNYVTGYESSAIYDLLCDKDASTWVEFDPAYKSCTDKKVSKALDRLLNPPRKKKRGVIEMGNVGRAVMVVVGQFNGPKPGIAIGTQGKRILTGYGHLNGYKYQLIVKCVEQANPVSKK